MKLYLEDGTVFEGKSVGASIKSGKQVHGEVVFNTGMVGYPEGFTDPSYAGQILVCTYPLIGNYGVPDLKTLESEKVQIRGLIVSEYCEEYSHANAKMSLGQWLKDSGIPAISGIDTRALTKKLRERGVMLGQMSEGTATKTFNDPNEENLVAAVSPKKKKVYGDGAIKIIALDCGMKENIVRSLARPGVTLIRVPWDYDFTTEKYDALFISNGPGDPTQCTSTINHIQAAMHDSKPILGICLGNQLLALAAGAFTYKLKYGHRAQNQPAIESTTGRCYITSQNHGFAVDTKTLPDGWEEWFSNANDGSNEGIRHKSKPWRSVQFHPEANPGPTDTAWIFDEFLKSLKTV